MILISKKISATFVMIICTICICRTTYASYIIDATKNHSEGPGEKMILDLGVAGDSYGGFLIDNITKMYPLNLSDYCKAGTTIAQNKNSIIECIYDKYKYIVISIGVNDHRIQTPIEDFLNQINIFAELAKKLNKYIIFHTYMPYPAESLSTINYTCDNYDRALRLIASINSHVKYIDMHDINGEMYCQDDRIHYNHIFYKYLIDRIFITLEEIKNEK